MRLVLSIVAALAFSGAADAATVGAVHGNIVLNGKPITGGGHDSAPVLSPDGKRIVFVRAGGVKPIEGCAADTSTATADELWTVGSDGKNAHALLSVHTVQDVTKTICAFNNPQFSSNGQLLYFDTPAWATSGALHVYDFRTGKERFLLASNGTQVLSACADKQYRDDLIVAQHRYFVFGGSYDWLWLFGPDGKEIGAIGENDDMAKDACAP
jgi:hypothetical protein